MKTISTLLQPSNTGLLKLTAMAEVYPDWLEANLKLVRNGLG